MHIILSNGIKIPAIGFGTWQIPAGDIAYRATFAALQAGYRHIDTAMAYGNEKSIGKALKDSGIDRNRIFVTTKLPAEIKGYQEAMATFHRSLGNLGLDFIDLYLIHAPKPWGVAGDGMNYMDRNIATWQAFEKLYNDGLIRAIGVSNFEPKHLTKLLSVAKVKPMVNQIKIHPGFIPVDNIDYCHSKQIALEAYSPLATGRLLSNQQLERFAQKYNRSAAQIAIRWSYQNGYLPLPKSTNENRIKENINIFDFTISPEDMSEITKIG